MALTLAGCEKPKTVAPAESAPKKNKATEEVMAAETPAPVDEKKEEIAETNERSRALPRPPDKPHPKPEPASHPFAVAVEGKPGFVLSPYSNKVIDVNNIPSGTLVQDPTAPADSKSYFRVP